MESSPSEWLGEERVRKRKRRASMYLFYPRNMEGLMHLHRLGQFQPYFHKINHFEMLGEVGDRNGSRSAMSVGRNSVAADPMKKMWNEIMPRFVKNDG